LRHHRFTVDEYYRMVPAGLLSEGDRVELIDGEIIEMSALGSPHASCVGLLTREFSAWVGERALVWVQNPARRWPRWPSPTTSSTLPPFSPKAAPADGIVAL
jgi:Uma2 family endonuclease